MKEIKNGNQICNERKEDKFSCPTSCTTHEFIHLCRLPTGKDRLLALEKDTGISIKIIEKYQKDIEKLFDFILKIDDKSHKNKEIYFLDTTFHRHIASDFRSIVINSLSKQEYQSNMILRHLIETFIVSIWIDITSRFQFQNSLNHFLNDHEWKPYRSQQRMTWEMG